MAFDSPIPYKSKKTSLPLYAISYGSAKNILFDTYSSDPNLSSKDITSLLITGQKFDASGSAQIYAGTELSKNLSVGVKPRR